MNKRHIQSTHTHFSHNAPPINLLLLCSLVCESPPLLWQSEIPYATNQKACVAVLSDLSDYLIIMLIM